MRRKTFVRRQVDQFIIVRIEQSIQPRKFIFETISRSFKLYKIIYENINLSEINKNLSIKISFFSFYYIYSYILEMYERRIEFSI